MEKKKAIILGATGAAGQNVIEFLADHPWFEISALAASERSEGLTYKKAIEGAVFFETHTNDEILNMKVKSVSKSNPKDYDIAFSALPSSVAREHEAVFAKHIPVVSTASAYRYEDDTPIIIPVVNTDHIDLIKKQKKNHGWKGFIVPGANCTTIGLIIILKPIHDKFNVTKVSMVSLQSLSGAGEKGLREDSPYRRSVIKNVLPYIEGEEGKVVAETKKILGTLKDGKIIEAEINIHTTCTRVDVETVHTEAVHLGTEKPHSIEKVKELLLKYVPEAQELNLPSAPKKTIIVLEDDVVPQPVKHRDYPKMVTIVGRLRENKLFENGLSFVLTSDNLEMGAGGGAVLTAELLYAKKLL